MPRLAKLVLPCLVPLAVIAPPAVAAPSGSTKDYVVVFDSSVRDIDDEVEREERAQNFRARQRYRHAIDGFVARLTERQAAAVARHPRVDIVTPDRPVAATMALAANETVPEGVRRIGAATATSASSAGANVAVLDTGVDLDHPDLNVVSGKNCSGSGPADDDNGHGTHAAGTIAARNAGGGVVGVAPGTKIYAVKVLGSNGSGSFSNIICGIDWATGTLTDSDPTNDIAVASLSLSGAGNAVGTCSSTADALHKAVCRSTAAGVVFTVAAGNSTRRFDDGSPDVPAAYPQAITVTAMADSDGRAGALGGTPRCDSRQRDDRHASFSNWAETSAGARHTMAAPGSCVLSTARGGGYSTMSGTSMATPHVAGAVSLCVAEGSCAGLRADDPARYIAAISSVDPLHGFLGDPENPVSGRAFGPLALASLGGDDPPPDPGPEPEPDTTAPAAPSGLTAAAGNGQVSLNWSDNGEDDLAGYDVYRATSSGGTYSKRNSATVTASAFTDGASNGTTYFYVVRARDRAGNVSGDSNRASATPRAPDTTAPRAPRNLSATAGDGRVSLNWSDNPESDLAGYDVFRSTTSGGTYSKVNAATVTESAYTDASGTPGTRYYYVVRARDVSGNVSGASNRVSATPRAAQDTTAPGAPSGLTATAGIGQVSLNWNDNGEPDLAGYDVYRATSSGGTYSKRNSATVTASAFTDGASNGATYFYVVRARDGAGNVSGDSNRASATPQAAQDTTAPAPPAGLAATAGNGQVSLNWADNGEADLAGYDVYRSTTAGGSYSQLNSATVTASEFTDGNATNGTRYHYVVRARDEAGNTSASSAEASATPEAPASTPIALTARPIAFGTNYAYLVWEGASSQSVDIYRNGAKVATTSNDGSHLENLGSARGTFRYKICEAGSTTDCSNEASASF